MHPYLSLTSVPLPFFTGGSVVRYLLDHPTEFRIRAVTRNPDSPASKALAEKGVEVVKGDAGDKGSCERACEGAWGVYGLTDCERAKDFAP